jgi:bacterial/archaeal transporter family-2 protein
VKAADASLSVTVLSISAAMLMGAGFAVQASMISAMGSLRGSFEATWVSLIATVAGFTLLMTARALAGGTIALPVPFRGAGVYGLIAAGAAVGLGVMVRGIPAYFAVTGLFAIPLLIGAGFLGPRLGVGLYLSAVIAGQLACSVVLDHVGAFGIPVHRIDAIRLAGVAALILGVVLVRGIKT